MTRFVLSTTICGAELGERDLDAFARQGFNQIELAAGAGRIDIRNTAAISSLQTWLQSSGVAIASLAVPWADAASALAVAIELSCPRIVLLGGRCRLHPAALDLPNDAGAFRRVLEPLAAEAARHKISAVVEFPRTWPPDTVIETLESLEDATAEVCLDIGHAHMSGGAPETIETLSGYLGTVHAHDNQGRDDQHRLPYSGSIDWPATLMSLWKTGFAGPIVLEAAPDPDAATTLARAVGARTRLQAILDDLAQPMVFPE